MRPFEAKTTTYLIQHSATVVGAVIGLAGAGLVGFAAFRADPAVSLLSNMLAPVLMGLSLVLLWLGKE